MLKHALKPRWLAALVLTILLSALFGLLARWQFSRSHEAPPPSLAVTESVKPLRQLYQPGRPLLAKEADHMVSAAGVFTGQQILVENRLQQGEKGYWTVAAFRVSGTGAVIPVLRGWSAEAKIADGLPQGQQKITARLLPPEAPAPGAAKDGRYASLSPAQLTNVWDVRMYDAWLAPAAKIPLDAPESLEHVVVGPQPQESKTNWLNVFYAIEWTAFATIAFYLWWRLVRRDYLLERDGIEPGQYVPPTLPEQQDILREQGRDLT